jgi:hypothetical protein
MAATTTDAFSSEHGSTEVGEPNVTKLPIADKGEDSEPAVGKDKLLEWIQEELDAADKHITTFRDAALECYRFKAGKQMEPKAENELIGQGRPHNAFNTAQKYIRFVSGVERNSPEMLVFAPEEEFDTQAQMDAENVTRAYEWEQRISSGALERSRAFEDLLTCGVGVTDKWVRSTDGLREKIGSQRVSPLEVLWPESSEQNLKNTRWRAREIFMDKDQVIRRWPDSEQRATAMSLGGFQGRPDSAQVQYVIPYVTTVDQSKKQARGDRERKLKVLEFQWWEEEEGYAFQDPLQGDLTWMTKKDFQEYNRRVMAVYRQRIEGFEEKDQKVFRRIYLLERAHQLGDIGKMAAGRFTLNFMTGMWDEDERQWFGFFKVLIDPQKYANKFFNQLIEIVGKQAKSGFLMEEGVVEAKHRREFEDNYSKPGTTQIVAEGSISGGKIMPKPQGEIPQTAMGILQFCTSSMETVTGLVPASLGLDSGNVQQGTQRQRLAAGLVLLAQEFDALKEFRIEEALISQALLKVIADGRQINGGQNPYDSFIVRLDRKIFERMYAIYLDDTEHDPSLRARFSATIMGLMPNLMRSGNWVPELWDFVYDLPMRARESIKKAFQEQQQHQQEMIKAGFNPSGKGQPRDPVEQQAKIQKLQAEAAALYGRAESLTKGRAARDFHTIVTALAEAERVRLDQHDAALAADEHATNESKSIVDIAHRVSDLYSPAPQKPDKGSSWSDT